MKRRLFSLLLAFVLLLAALPVTTFAATTAVNVVVKDATYYGNGSLKSMTTTFDWNSATVYGARLILSSEYLSGSNGYGTGYGDFSDAGAIFKQRKFKTYSDAEAYDKANGKPYGFIRSSDPMDIGGKITMSLTIPEGTIPMDKDGTYYIYLWVTYRNRFYPDNLICAIQVQNGQLLYTPATEGEYYRNYYDKTQFTPVENEAKYDVTVIPGGNMTRDPASGAESQLQLSSAMTPVIYTANPGYTFPSDYAVAPVNGIQVQRLSGTQIQVYGTPSATTRIALNPAVASSGTTPGNPPAQPNPPAHICTPSGWKWDDTNHWQWICTDSSCQNYHAKTNLNPHVFDDAHDPTCNTCGYTRVAPAERPNTGDITNIPLWAMLFFVGTALMWVQLAQRKREQF